MAIDGDGSPFCYHPESGRGLDKLGNAGTPGDWTSLECGDDGVPIVQRPNDPAPGFYVSTTKLQDSAYSTRDPRRYVDSQTVPYVVAAKNLVNRFGVKMADVAMVLYKSQQVGAIVADVGPKYHYGEGSIALAEAFGIPSSPRTGGVRDGVTFVLFTHSNRGWPRPIAEFQAQATELFNAWGGLDAIPWLRPTV